jgi:hypothetical protein
MSLPKYKEIKILTDEEKNKEDTFGFDIDLI